MDGSRIRRLRGEPTRLIGMLAELNPDVKARMDKVADLAKLSLALAVEALIDQMPDVVAPGTYGSPAEFRRRRGPEATPLAVRIPLASKAKVDRLKRLNGRGTTVAQVLDHYIRRLDMSPASAPRTWAHDREASQEELPITGT